MFDLKLLTIWVVASLAAQLVASEANAQELGPNAPAANRANVEMHLQDAGATALQELEFTGEATEDIVVEEKIFGQKVKIKLGEAKGKAKVSFLDPKKNLKVEIPSLRRSAAKEAKVECKSVAPFQVAIDGSVLGVKGRTTVTAVANLTATAKVVLADAPDKKVKVTPEFLEWQTSVTELKLNDPIADAVFAKVVERLANDWLSDNKKQLLEAANTAVQKAAETGKLTTDIQPLLQ